MYQHGKQLQGGDVMNDVEEEGIVQRSLVAGEKC